MKLDLPAGVEVEIKAYGKEKEKHKTGNILENLARYFACEEYY